MSDPVNLLLVDDRPENLLALEAILEPLELNLIRANSGKEALREVLLHDFAVILMDVQMPGLNGFETAELIKARERSKHTPIIFLTAISKDDEYVFTGYSVGAVDYMFKPLQADILRSKVAVFVDLFRKTQELKEQQELVRQSALRDAALRHETELRTQAEASSAELTAALEELKGAHEKLGERQKLLEQAISSRSRFYANMSHELRTPINAIIGYSSLMLDEIYGPLEAQQKRGVERTYLAAKHLLELVNDVLDLSKVEAGKIELELQRMELPGPIEDLFITLKPLTDQFGSEISLVADGDPRTITTDPRRVRQIMLNLLSNAVKFGGGKPIQVVYSPADEGGIELSVVDQGAGISDEDQLKIFDEFVQLKQENRENGTGLGLSISLRLAQLLDGDLRVESAPGEGSTFTLTLPPNVTMTMPGIESA